MKVIAGWSSPVARRAHNPKVASSNLAPATKQIKGLRIGRNPFFFVRYHYVTKNKILGPLRCSLMNFGHEVTVEVSRPPSPPSSQSPHFSLGNS